MKILHVLDCLGGGGVEEWVKNICLLCDRNKFNFKIYFCGCIYDSNSFDYNEDFRKSGLEVVYRSIKLFKYNHSLNLVKNISDRNYFMKQLRRIVIYFTVNLIGVFQLYNIVKHDKFDIIHVHLYRLFIPAGLVGKLFGVPVIHTVPGLKSQLDSYLPLIYCIYKYFGFLVDTFVTSTSEQELMIYAKVPKDKIKFIKSAIDLKRVKVIKRENNPIVRDYGLHDSFPILLSVGRMDREKGHIYSISALKKLIMRFPNIKLIILGDGVDLDSIRTLVIKEGLRDYVILPGFRKDIENFHSVSDIYLRTSIYEGVNMASLMAMAYGKPVIGFNTQTTTEIIINGENGILVPNRDVGKLAEAISLLVDGGKELRQSLGKKSMEYVYRNCDIMNAIQAYESIYSGLTKTEHTRLERC